MASLEDTALQLPIRSGHTYTGTAGHDSARQHLGDNYVINQSGFTIHTDPHATSHANFTGHYSSTVLHPVVSYVARPELQLQMKERLHDTVERRGRSAKILVLCGLGGAGKSQLTRSYIESYRDDYTAIFWIDAGARTRLEADYKQIRNLLHSSYRTDVDLNTCVAEVKQWCHQKQGRWLFVYDSADDIDDPQSTAYIDLRRIVVDALSADVIITTRSQSANGMMPTDLEAVQVAEMAPAEARDLFLRRSKLPSPSVDLCEEVDAIAKELGFFALAINLAAAYVAETPRLRKHPGRYLDEYRRRRKTLLDRKPKAHVDQCGSSVLTTWETSYDAMFDRCPEACKLLLFLAFLSPDDLFLELLQTDDKVIIEGHATWLLTETSSALVQEVLDSSFEMLRSYSLLLWRDEQSSYSMHKLVHAWSFERSEIQSKVEFCKIALGFLGYYASSVSGDVVMSARMVPHITTCFIRACEVYAESDIDKVGIVDGIQNLADFLSKSGSSNWGYELYSFVHDHYRRIRCGDQTKYFGSVGNLGRVMLNMGRFKDVVELLRPALSQYRESYGPDHRSGLGALIARTLGGALGEDGKYTEAELLLRQALGECETPNDTLAAMRFLASVLSRNNRNKEAGELSRQAFDCVKRYFGPTHQAMFHTTIDHAELLNRFGQYEESKSLTRQAVCDFEATLGSQHTRTVMCMAQYGLSCYLLGDSREATRLLRQALLGLETAVGMDHRFTLQCVFHLARCLRDRGSHYEALALFQRASDGYAAIFGSDHQHVLLSSSISADIRFFLQERAALREAFEQANSRFDERLQEGQHLQRKLFVRGRAQSAPGRLTGIKSRLERNLIWQQQSDGREESGWENVSDPGRDVTEAYGYRYVASN